uniref:SusC/RagA family TonB-linked outer membrane protein n=1 Tax=Roseihalotalea indica TaxID=2867963 RepID=A0AA49JEH6_9BACT|nr:SusC/RagA family TonB-linked outer membrane protein [Tunicatimonas sp. TK19036]
MKQPSTLLMMLLLLFGGSYVFAQDNTVSGKVTGPENAGLPGVNILVTGTATGTVTDVDGNYRISASEDATLTFSYIGYITQTVEVNGRSEVNVTMSYDDQSLDEVVVTALGIKREAKSLGYAVSEVDGEEISVNRTPNMMSTLQGKMAGVNISSMTTGPAGTSKVRIRGQSSFSGQNNPLIVINGVPVDNSNYAIGGNFGNRAQNSSDGGDGLSSINPDDIESMTVLKGGTAAALYGSRAKDGVIMITTKTGSRGAGLGIEFNTNFTTETPLDFTDFQYEYGQGERGVRPTSAYPTSGVWSFGEKFEPGMTQVLFDGEEWPYEPVYDRFKKFYNVGTNWTNTVTLSNGGENGSFSLSFANTDNKGIMPNAKFNRQTINLGFNQNINEKLSVQGNINYSNEDNDNPPQINTQDFAVPTVVATLANSMPLEALEQNQTLPNGDEFVFSRFLVRNNPYYSLSHHFENINRDRLFGNLSVRYQLADWMYVQGRIAQDFYVRNQDYNIPNGYAPIPRAPEGFVNGSYTQDVRQFREANYDFLIGANHSIGGDFALDVTLGGNQRYVRMEYNSVTVKDFIQPDLYTVMNGREKNPLYSLSEREVNSLYGAAEVSFREFAFLNVTARNDWFSTLAPGNRSILYPSVTGSFVFSQAIASLPNWLSFGKLRAAYAEVGDDNVAPYSNALYYSVENNLFPTPSGQPVPIGGIYTNTIPNSNLRPLRVSEAEVGVELRMLEDLIRFDFTYYRKITEDQILAAQVPDVSGYTNKLINVGRSLNRGLEMLLSFSPVNTPSFRWDASLNASYNTSEVLKLGASPADTMITVGGGGGSTLRQVVGKPIGQLFVFGYLRDDQGRKVFDANSGRPMRDPDPINVGSALPRYFGGITNTFTYKGIRLSTLIDFKLGHKMIAGSNMNYLRHGLHKRTLVGREEGYVIGDGVNPNGEINTTRSDLQPFYETPNVLGIYEDWVFNAGFWKLRQVTLGYDLTRLLPENFFIRGLRLDVVSNNVLVLKKWTENMDPEMVNNSSDNALGLDFWPSLPPTRSIGFNLNVKF